MSNNGTNGTYLESGILVVTDISIRGCVSYRHSDHEERANGDRSVEADWKTHKRIEDVDEQRRLMTTRQNAVNALGRVGVRIGNLGVYVPASREDELQEALRQIDADVANYNAEARCTRISANVLQFRIDGSDERVARALYDRATDLLDRVATAIKAGDIKGLRAGLRDMNGLDAVLPSGTAERVSQLVIQARSRARAAAKEIREGNGEAVVETAQRMLRSVPVDAVRAALIEAAPNGKRVAIAPVDARQVE